MKRLIERVAGWCRGGAAVEPWQRREVILSVLMLVCIGVTVTRSPLAPAFWIYFTLFFVREMHRPSRGSRQSMTAKFLGQVERRQVGFSVAALVSALIADLPNPLWALLVVATFVAVALQFRVVAAVHAEFYSQFPHHFPLRMWSR